MAGYSGTPLAKKLGIKNNFRAALLHVPDEVKSGLREALAKCQIQNTLAHAKRDLDFIFLFANDIKVCAVNEVWSGLKFVIPVKNRPKDKQRTA
jgi:hypothetical protein